MGSGKSTLAAALADSLGASLLQTDQLRREKYGESPQLAGYGEGLYRQACRDGIYRDMLQSSSQSLARGASVILDGTFSAAWLRRAARELAVEHHADFLMIRCVCPREIAIRRIEQRRRTNESTSEAHRDLYDQQAAAWEEASPPEDATVIIDSRQTLQEQVQQTLSQISQAATNTHP